MISEGPAQLPRLLRFWPWLIYGVYGLLVVVTFDHIEDDAFIYYRVGAHLANGHGYVFNAGGERIEVGSSIVWQALIALACLVHVDVIVFSKLLGVALGAGTLHLLLGLSQRVIRGPLLVGVPSLLLVVTIPFYGWIQRGLETSLYVFSIVLLARTLTEARHRHLWPWATLLVALSRSEGPMVLAGLAGFFWFERRSLRQHARGALVVAGALVAVALGRLLYFHDFVPHPFYLKIQEIPGAALAATRLYFEATHTWILVLAGVVGLVNRSVWDRPLVTVALLNVPFLVWGLRTFALVEYNRHLVPALPLLYLLSVRGIDALSSRFRPLQLPMTVGTFAFAAWLWLGAPSMNLSVNPRENLFRADLREAAAEPLRHFANLGHLLVGDSRGRVDAARYGRDSVTESWTYLLGGFIDHKYPPGTTIAYDQMGQCPWYSGLDMHFLDTWGLTYRPTAFPFFNERLEENRGGLFHTYHDVSERLLRRFWPTPYRTWSREQAVDSLFAIRPHVIILNLFMVQKKGAGGGIELDRSTIPGLIAADPRLREHYVERVKWFLRIYERRDLAARTTWAEEEHVFPGIPGR